MAHLGSRVAAFVDGQLSVDDAADVRAHLEGCESCRDAVRAQQRLKQRTAWCGIAPEPPAALLHQLSALQDSAGAEPSVPRRRRALAALGSARAGAVVLVASTTLGVAAFAWALGGPPPSTSAATTPPIDRFVADFGAAASAPQGGVVQAALASSSTGGAETASLGRDGARTLLAAAGDSVGEVDLSGADVRIGGTGVVAGQPATEVVVARSGRREAAYWISRASGRAVRTVAYDRDGTPRERTIAPAAADTATSTPLSESAMVSLTRSGWPCHERLADDLRRVEGALVRGTAASQDVVSLDYADGASRLSLHEQSGSLDPGRLEGFRPARLATTSVWLREGRDRRPTVATWDRDGIVYTVVTDTDLERLAGVVGDLPHAAPAGPVDRVQRGLVRMTRWADPLSP